MALAWQELAADILAFPDEYLAEHARRSLLAFTRRLFPTYQTAAHHERIADALEAVERGELSRLIITMPPRHGKSTLASEHFPAWFVGRNPERRIIACSHTALLAYAFSRRARNKLTDPRWPFPAVHVAGDLRNVQSWDIDGFRGGYVAAGVGGPITGYGADCLVIDDPVKSAADADSPTARENAWEWFTGTAATRLEPGGSIVVIGTRWHEDDLIGRLISAGGWETLHLPALDDAGDPLWPERFDATALARIKREIGTRNFQAQYQGRPSPAGGGVWKKRWFRYWTRQGEPMPPVYVKDDGGGLYQAECRPLPPVFDSSLQSWDMTFKKTNDGSFVVGQVWGRTGADCFLLDEFRARVDFPDAVIAVEVLSNRWPVALTKLVENKANGPAVVAVLQKKIPGLIEVDPKGGKEARANAVQPLIQSGNVYLPHPSLASWTDDWLDEAAGFPTAKHDDRVDAASQGLVHFVTSMAAAGYSYSYLETDGDTEEVGANGYAYAN